MEQEPYLFEEGLSVKGVNENECYYHNISPLTIKHLETASSI